MIVTLIYIKYRIGFYIANRDGTESHSFFFTMVIIGTIIDPIAFFVILFIGREKEKKDTLGLKFGRDQIITMISTGGFHGVYIVDFPLGPYPMCQQEEDGKVYVSSTFTCLWIFLSYVVMFIAHVSTDAVAQQEIIVGELKGGID
ncbi:hypothetical protein ACJX0J_019504 [Zea mays]